MRRVTDVDYGQNRRLRGGWYPGFKSESHRERFIAAGRRNLARWPYGSHRCCIAICRAGHRCPRNALANSDRCFKHDPRWRPKDPYTPRRQRARAIQAAKRYNARVYAALDAELAMLPPMPPTEYDALRQAMLRGRLIWIAPLDEWIKQGMPWPPQAPDTRELPTGKQGQS
jgi:hypothetical protein